MKIYEVTDEKFRKYGRVVKNIDTTELIETLKKVQIPEEVIYEPAVPELESLPVAKELQDRIYGELPVQIGYCIGNNHKLNAVEYHRNSEINIAATPAILIVGCQQDVTDDFYYDTDKMEAFRIPEGTAVELYATTLHYAPCNAKDTGFLVAVVLPKGTNYPLKKVYTDGEAKLLAATNKWLIGHAEGGLAEGVHLGLRGENLTV